MPCLAAMDFGTDPDPTTCIVGHWGKGPLDIYESYYRSNTLSKDHADALGPMFIRYHIHWVVYDCRSKGLQKELAAAIEDKYHLGIEWIPALGSLLVEDGVWTIKGLIHQVSQAPFANLVIDRFLGKDMINEMETWERDKTTGKCKARGPNHTIDPLRYFIWFWQVLARRGEIRKTTCRSLTNRSFSPKGSYSPMPPLSSRKHSINAVS